MSLRLQLLQVARLAPRLLGDSTDLMREFFREQITAEGAGRDRAGRPDLYYTIFALAGMQALDVEIPRGLPPDEAGLATLGIFGRLAQRTQFSPTGFTGNAYSDLIAGDCLLFGIGGSNAVEVIDISRPSAPVKIGAFRGPWGTDAQSTFTAVRGSLRGQRLAITGFGARVLDVSDPRNLRLVQAIDYTLAGTDRVNPVLSANHIVVAKGKELLSFDLDTGRQVSSVSLAALGFGINLQLNGTCSPC